METLDDLLKRLAGVRDYSWRDESTRQEAIIDELMHVVPLMLEKMIELESRLKAVGAHGR